MKLPIEKFVCARARVCGPVSYTHLDVYKRQGMYITHYAFMLLTYSRETTHTRARTHKFFNR